jgi:hypothetical protein
MAQPRLKEKPRSGIKEQAHRIIDRLPDDATWDDVMYALHVRVAIENGRKASREGRLTSQDDVEKRFGITK